MSAHSGSQPFGAGRLLDDLRRRTTAPAAVLDTVLDDVLVEPLTVMCDALEATAELDEAGRAMTERYLARLLDGRVALEAYRLEDPGVVDEVIAAPIVVIGPPRSGTTTLHRLLGSVDPHRYAEGWEFWMPVPPPDPTASDEDPRIAAAAEELGFPQARNAGLTKIHEYSSRMPKECLSAMAFSMRTEEFISRYHVPDYVDWLQRNDRSPGYDALKLVLQVLQRRTPGRRWLLKSPVHLQGIPELVATFPDAQVVVAHRDPNGFLASVSSLIVTLRSAFSERHDPVEVGRYHLDLYADSLNALGDHIDTGTLSPEQTHHIRHRDIITDAPAAVGELLGHIGVEVDATVAATIEATATAERNDALGAHRYDSADYGLADEAMIRERYAPYIARFL